MIVVMKTKASQLDIDEVKAKALSQGHEHVVIEGVERTVVAVSGHVIEDHRVAMKLLDNVQDVIAVGRPYKLASRSYKESDTQIKVGNITIGGGELALIAGPDRPPRFAPKIGFLDSISIAIPRTVFAITTASAPAL